MEFCPDCGTRLTPVAKKEEEKRGLTLTCPKCGYKKKVERQPVAPAQIVEHSPQEQIAVIGRKEQRLRTVPTVRIVCPKCGNTTAYVWQVQTRGTDESMTQFYRCTKCNYTYREYS